MPPSLTIVEPAVRTAITCVKELARSFKITVGPPKVSLPATGCFAVSTILPAPVIVFGRNANATDETGARGTPAKLTVVPFQGAAATSTGGFWSIPFRTPFR